MATKFVNQIDFTIPAKPDHSVEPNPYHQVGLHSLLIHDLIPEEERLAILNSLQKANWQPVSITGMSGNWTPGEPIGSYRASNYNPKYASALWERIKHSYSPVRIVDDYTNDDFDHHQLWEPVGISPLLRFIKYIDKGKLIVHYDSPYIQDEETRTLQSLVIYIDHTPTLQGGATRYLHDPNDHLPLSEMDLRDQIRSAKKEEVHTNFTPPNGTGIIFDHRTLHDAEEVNGEGHKIIIRTDIMYKKVKD